MACLSWKLEHTKGFVVAANPIYLLSDLGVTTNGSIEFEILESDADLLIDYVSVPHTFYINDDTGVFTARLSPFVRTISTHSGLALVRNQPVLRGRLEIIKALAP